MARNPDGWGRKAHKWRGRWRSYLTVGYRSDGTPDRRYVYGKTEGECLEKLDELRRQARHASVDARSLTVAAFLDLWLEEVAPELSERTVTIYRHDLAHMRSRLGRRKLSALEPKHIRRAMRDIVGSTVEFGKKGEGKQTAVLTARAANAGRVVLHTALAHAVSEGLIPYNPASKELVKPLRATEPEMVVWTAEEIQRFTETTRAGGCSLHGFFYVLLTTGLRVGELGALEWRDAQGGRIHVRQTLGSDGTKTPAARRTVPVPADAQQLLEEHRRFLLGEGVTSPLVFPTLKGGPVTRQHARKTLHLWAGKAGVLRLSPHGLRHTYASMMIAAGVDAATLARLLGHESAAFTLRTYVHFFERAQAREALTLDQLLGVRDRQGVFLGGTAGNEQDSGVLPN